MARQLQRDIARALQRGCTLMIYKISPRSADRRHGGRQLVSVGPYRTAIRQGRRYAMIDKDDHHEYLTAVTAAQAFIARVNRNRAWEALQRARCPRE